MYYKSDFQKDFKNIEDFKRIYFKNYEKDYRNYRGLYLHPPGVTSSGENGGFISLFVSFWKRYCANTSIHGIKYISQKNLHWSEKITWIILVLLAFAGVVYVSLLLSARFSDSPLATVIESTIYPVSSISYPAITICNYHRINWKNIDEAQRKLLPNADTGTIEVFKDLVKCFEVLEHGSFEQFDLIKNRTTNELDMINLTELFKIMMPSCEDLFATDVECWWRNKYIPCCSIFAPQKTEYGICYSFNSVLNEVGKHLLNTEHDYPRRTLNFGVWSGLRIQLNTTPESRVPESKHPAGFVVMVHDPEQWPNAGQFVPAGTQTSIIVKPSYSHQTPGVQRLTPQQRQCIFEHEIEKFDVKTLPGLKYLLSNCISECRQQYMVKYCDCSIDFMFPIGNYRPCDVSGLICLNKYDAILNYEKPPSGNPFFNQSEEGMFCDCLPECDRINYEIEVSSAVVGDSDKTAITMDIHYQSSTLVKYRTDVIFGWLDLIVAFGGITGLFLGCSILSMVETVYYFTYGFLIFATTHGKVLHNQVKPMVIIHDGIARKNVTSVGLKQNRFNVNKKNNVKKLI